MQCTGVNNENSKSVNFDSMYTPQRVLLLASRDMRCRVSAIIALFQIVTTSSWDSFMW
jgi:hypothetical protein